MAMQRTHPFPMCCYCLSVVGFVLLGAWCTYGHLESEFGVAILGDDSVEDGGKMVFCIELDYVHGQ